MNKRVFLSTAYLPPIDYYLEVASSEEVVLERFESYQKQSYRTRCHILSANGILPLSIPVSKGESELITDIRIDYSKPWVIQHERALISAYRSSPFFEHYQDDLFSILESGEESLFELNYKLMLQINDLIGITDNFHFTEDYQSYIKVDMGKDLRSAISPKKSPLHTIKPYWQVFSHKQGFIPNLSILDLLFNEGPESISFLL